MQTYKTDIQYVRLFTYVECKILSDPLQACYSLTSSNHILPLFPSLLGTVEFLDLKNSGAQLDDRCYSLLTSRVGHTLRRLEVVRLNTSDD